MARGDQKANRVSKVLVANRGEIAVRVIRACREMGIPTVAVFSDADRTALHVQKADEAVFIGAPPPRESYLNVDRIVAAARATGADAIHPGYGFLAESPAFAARVEEEGMVFIGPPPDVIRRMGSKIASRAAMREAGVPIVPGSERGSNDPEAVRAEAERVGLPVFVKASAGGGGHGLRLVRERGELDAAIRHAIGEAGAAFGDDTVYVERQIERPRHIEFQVLADGNGHTVHLFERECSIQRRHQKVLEETPSSALTPVLRARMGEAAVAAARAVGYVGAGTVEFMLDAEQRFYFLETNTRIQVEHPITELTTGIDLVQWQIRIARGEALAFAQDAIHQHGHAIECRVYAEDETRHFMPSCGVISYLYEPSGPGIRNDSGIYEGWEVSAHYDPILSKLVAYGENREQARARMLRALDEYVIHGVQTSIDLHKRILRHPEFVAGKLDTGFVERHADILLTPESHPVPDEAFIAGLLYARTGAPAAVTPAPGARSATSVWQRLGPWRVGGER